MKFTPQDFLDEPGAVVSQPAKEKRPKKERPPKKEKPEKKKKNVTDETIPLETEDTGFTEVEPARDAEDEKKLSRKAITGIVLLILFGFILFSLGIRGVISTLALEDTSKYQPAKTYDASYQEALEASVEDFEAANAKRLGEAAPAEEETKEEVPEEEAPIETENLENTTSKDEQIRLLQEEVSRLTEEAENAKNDAALKEQQLSQAQSLLEASEAREAQLQSDLDALAGGSK